MGETEIDREWGWVRESPRPVKFKSIVQYVQIQRELSTYLRTIKEKKKTTFRTQIDVIDVLLIEGIHKGHERVPQACMSTCKPLIIILFYSLITAFYSALIMLIL